MGANVKELVDGFVVRGPTRLKGVEVSVSGDPRIALAMTIAGLTADAETTLDDDSVVEAAYPSFYNDMRALTP
jgi:3-phosphoshikimate 1-carboxyvinyltransferase